MTFLLLSLVLVAATVSVVRPAMAEGAPLPIASPNGIAIVALFPLTLGVVLFLGPQFALAFALAWLLKELGHVLGYRLAGHDDARLRLLPMPGTQANSARAPDSDLAAFFILLMGPGLSLAPMVAAFAVSDVFAADAPGLASAARAFAFAVGALNFVALLPLWPLDGGRLIRIIVQARFPRIGGLAAVFFAALLVGMSWTTQSTFLFLLGIVSGLALVAGQPRPEDRPTLTRRQVRIGFTAYFAALSAFFLSGWWVLRLLPFWG